MGCEGLQLYPVAFVGHGIGDCVAGDRYVGNDHRPSYFHACVAYSWHAEQSIFHGTHTVFATHTLDLEFGFQHVATFRSWIGSAYSMVCLESRTVYHNALTMSDWKTFVAAYVTIFLAELGDKTQLATLSLAAGGGRGAKLMVFLGSALALCTTSALAVLAGEALSRAIRPEVLRKLAGVTFLLLGVLYLFPRRGG